MFGTVVSTEVWRIWDDGFLDVHVQPFSVRDGPRHPIFQKVLCKKRGVFSNPNILMSVAFVEVVPVCTPAVGYGK